MSDLDQIVQNFLGFGGKAIPEGPKPVGILDIISDRLIPEKGLNLEHTIDGIFSRGVGGVLGAGNFTFDVTEDQAKKIISERLQQFGIPKDMAQTVVADGVLSRDESIAIMSTVGSVIKQRLESLPPQFQILAKPTDTLEQAKDFAARHGITDQSTIEGLAYFAEGVKFGTKSVIDEFVGLNRQIPRSPSREIYQELRENPSGAPDMRTVPSSPQPAGGNDQALMREQVDSHNETTRIYSESKRLVVESYDNALAPMQPVPSH